MMDRALWKALVVAIAIAIASVLAGCKKDEPATSAPASSCTRDDAGCSCTIGTSSGGGSMECAPAAGVASLCCASADWPRSGTCSCAPVTCTETSSSSCHCGRPGEGGTLALCAGAACCLKGGGDCYCRKQATGIMATCDPGDELSAFCKREGVACPPELTKVDGCSL